MVSSLPLRKTRWVRISFFNTNLNKHIYIKILPWVAGYTKMMAKCLVQWKPDALMRPTVYAASCSWHTESAVLQHGSITTETERHAAKWDHRRTSDWHRSTLLPTGCLEILQDYTDYQLLPIGRLYENARITWRVAEVWIMLSRAMQSCFWHVHKAEIVCDKYDRTNAEQNEIKGWANTLAGIDRSWFTLVLCGKVRRAQQYAGRPGNTVFIKTTRVAVHKWHATCIKQCRTTYTISINNKKTKHGWTKM
jgi:hypothetical protein